MAGITPQVEAAVRTYAEHVKKDIPISAIYVFGSHAKGSARRGSDIDIAVFSPSFGADRFQDGVFLQQKIWSVREANLDVVGYNPKDLDDPYSPLMAEIKKHGVRIEM